MVYTVYVKQILYYVATNTWHHQIMFHFLLRSYLPTLVISNQIFVQYCSSNVSLFAALHSLNGLYKCMELSQQFATFMKLALVCRIYICLFTFQRTVPPWKTSISTVDKLCKLVLAFGSWNEFPILIQLLADGGQWHLQYILIYELDNEVIIFMFIFRSTPRCPRPRGSTGRGARGRRSSCWPRRWWCWCWCSSSSTPPGSSSGCTR